VVEHTYREFDVVEEQGFDVITSEGSLIQEKYIK